MARRGRPPYPDVLTPREFEVLGLLREDLSNEEVAQQLGISLAGAKYHVSEILSKLGVATREEAAAWRSERPWWAAAFAPLVWLRRFGWPQAAALVSAIAVAAGIGLLVWGLVRTNGDDERLVAAQTSTPATPAAPTSTLNLPPLPTRTPFVGGSAGCPGTFEAPEEAIEACAESRRSGHIYVGDCDTPTPSPPGTGFDRPCSSWEDGVPSPRSYVIGGVGVDGFDRFILEEGTDGWTVTLSGGCGAQTQADADLLLQARYDLLHDGSVDFSQVRIDDCRFPPPPLERPTLRVGEYEAVSAENGRTRLSLSAGRFYVQRGVRLSVSVENISSTTLPWTSDVGADITLTADDGTVYPASEIGGSLARSIPEGIAPGAFLGGWLVFPIETFGSYTLSYPGQPDVSLDLTPEAYRTSRLEYFDSLKD